MKHVVPAVWIVALAPTTALAHAGHGDAKWVDTALHYLIEPVHWPQVIAVAVILVVVGRSTRRRQSGDDGP